MMLYDMLCFVRCLQLEAPPATVQFRFILTLYRTDALLALHAFLLAGITIYDIHTP